MEIKLLRPPPALTVSPPWRDIYVAGAFAQRELAASGEFASLAKERSMNVGIGDDPLEDLDRAGALQPIAFADGGYARGWQVPAEPLERMNFREERGYRGWREYAYEADGYPAVSAVYSPWQLLYLDNVLDGTGADISLESLLLPDDERAVRLGQLRAFLTSQDAAWRALDDAWRPLLKVLVRLQSRYWPQVTGLVAVVPDRQSGGYITAGQETEPDAPFDPARVLGELGCGQQELLDAYHFLVERGIDLEPQDGLVMLRRARPRAFHTRWRGHARRAQDHFDAAEVLRLYLLDLTGEPPPRVPMWPLDGRQPERAAVYDHGPAAPFTREEVKQLLVAAELYPHGVHLLADGASEQIVVERIVEALLGPGAVSHVAFHDLGGKGSAKHVEPLVRSFGEYAIRTLVVVDREGRMAEYVEAAIRRGAIPQEDVLIFPESLERSNATTDELIELARDIAAHPPQGEERVEFVLDGDELLRFHEERRERAGRDKPGLAESLVVLVHRKTNGKLYLDKLQLVEALAEMLVAELQTPGATEELAALRERRPIVAFVLDRLVPAINRPLPAGRNR